jgi:hypothetical protein
MGELRGGTNSQYKNFVWNSDRWNGFSFRDGDIVISTPPKCGTTWMQMQCALLLFRTPDLPAPLAHLSPWIDMNTRPLAEVHADLEAQTHRRFIKTHTPLGGVPWDERVTYVHVARDPRDAARSWDNHMANMDMDRLIEVRANAVGLDDLTELGLDGMPPEPPDEPAERFWRWVEGAGEGSPSGLAMLVDICSTFWAAREEPNVHLFHYGDLQADLAGQMARLAEALGVDPPTDELVDAARFERMRARADELVPNSDTPIWRSPTQFFDRARAGDWRDLVDDHEVPRYDGAVRSLTTDEELIAWLHAGSLG